MLVPSVLSNDASPLLATVGAPLFLSAGVVPLVLRADALLGRAALHPLDATDPAGWHRAREWLLGAPIERVHRLSSTSSCAVAEHAGGRWRTLRRHGSVQSVTLRQPGLGDEDAFVPCHSSAGNEYLKVMASAYAALSGGESDGSTLHLGLGGGSLPMLLGDPCTAIELDADAADLAVAFCGLDPTLVSIVRGGDALRHSALAPGPHSCVFVDVFGQDNNVPPPFAEEAFVRTLWDSLDDGGLVIANFHWNGRFAKNEEDARLEQAARAYARVFGDGGGAPSGLVLIPSRYQGNMILCARKGGKNGRSSPLSPEDFDIDAARRFATQKGWRFDPGARLEAAEEAVLFQ